MRPFRLIWLLWYSGGRGVAEAQGMPRGANSWEVGMCIGDNGHHSSSHELLDQSCEGEDANLVPFSCQRSRQFAHMGSDSSNGDGVQ